MYVETARTALWQSLKPPLHHAQYQRGEKDHLACHQCHRLDALNGSFLMQRMRGLDPLPPLCTINQVASRNLPNASFANLIRSAPYV